MSLENQREMLGEGIENLVRVVESRLQEPSCSEKDRIILLEELNAITKKFDTLCGLF